MSKEQVAEIFRKAGYQQASDEALQVLPDQVEQDQLEKFCRQQGIFLSDLISRMGGSP